MSTLMFKCTRTGRKPTHAGGSFEWPSPEGRKPGKWTPTVDNITVCRRGYHLTTARHLADWLSDELWVAEGRGEQIESDTKTVFASARLLYRVDDSILRLWAADCAEHILYLFENERPGDNRPRLAIQAARAYACGEISAAAWAAWAAARDAAWDAARAAARDAAWAAAGAAWAAWAAAGAAWAAARAAERDWQADRLETLIAEAAWA